MRRKQTRDVFVRLAGFSALLVAVSAVAEINVPLTYWQAPLSWSYRPGPDKVVASRKTEAGNVAIEPLVLPSASASFVAIAPCRILDTRPLYSAAYAPGQRLQAGVPVTFGMSSAPAPCNTIPSNAVAFSLNVAVVSPNANGFLSAFPGAIPPNPLTSLVNFTAGQVIANASVVPGDDSGLVGFMAGSASLDLVVDINGYYAPGTPGSSVPVGTILSFGGTVPPTGFLMCDGSLVSRATYAALFSAISVNFGAGDLVSNFNLPDLRGRFLRGVTQDVTRDPDYSSRTAMAPFGNTGGTVGSVQDDNFLSHTHAGTMTNTVTNTGQSYAVGPSLLQYFVWNHGTTATGGNETRPKNANLNFIIKY